MGHSYRDRHISPATTTATNDGGTKTDKPNTSTNAPKTSSKTSKSSK